MGARLQDKVAVVTGAAAGIGEATAELFAAEGARVVLVDIEPTGEAVAQRIRSHGGAALFVAADISVEADVQRAMQLADETFGRIDILINNAAVFVLKGSRRASRTGGARSTSMSSAPRSVAATRPRSCNAAAAARSSTWPRSRASSASRTFSPTARPRRRCST
jgi:NAD(P)-dependent dehydrogenase (short-subunit alcohol dehydrogenase family)